MSTQQDATVNIHVNKQEAEEKVKELSARARQLRQEFAEAVRIGDKGTIAKTEKELKKVNKELNNATLRSARIRDAMKHLSQATPKELHNTLKLINQELNSGAIKRGSKEWKAYQEQIKKVNAELRQIQNETRETESMLSRTNKFVSKWGSTIVGGMAALTGVTMAGKQAVQAYADMDTALANTQKYTGMTREDVELLNEEFKKMDTRTSREGLNELAQAAGRLGKNTVEDVMGFVRAGDIIGVAMDELGEEAPQIISQLAGIFNLEGELGTEKAMLSVGSAINTLSQNCAAGAPNLVDFASRLGAIANSTNMSMDEMLAFGALLDDQKVSVEKASTAMQTVITKMYAEPAKFAKTAGLNVKEFTDALKRSSTEGIMMFVDQLSKMDSMQQAATLKELHVAGAGVVQTFQTLAGKTDLLRQQMDTSRQAFNDATSATEEFNVQNNTVQAKLDKARKKFTELAVVLGEQLYPYMGHITSATSMLMKVMLTLIKFIVEHKNLIIALVIAYGSYKTVIAAATIAQKVHNAYLVISNSTTKTLTATSLLFKAAMLALTGQLGKAKIAMRAFSIACASTPWGAIIAAIGALVGGYALLNGATEDNIEINEEAIARQNQLKEAMDRHKKAREDTLSAIDKEKARLIELDKIANDELRSKAERIQAMQILNNLIPDYNAHLDQERDAYIKNKQALDEYITSMEKRMLAAHFKDEYEEYIGELSKASRKLEQFMEKHKDKIAPYIDNGFGVYDNDDPIRAMWGDTRTGEFIKNEQAFLKAINQKNFAGQELLDAVNTFQEKEQAFQNILNLREEMNKTGISFVDAEATEPLVTYTPPKTDKELKEEEKARKAAEKARKQAEADAKEALEKDLDAQKAHRDKEHALNLSAYSLGEKTYLDYIDDKHKIDIDAVTKQKKILEDANLTETEEYAKLLKIEEELNAKHLQQQSQLKLEQLNRDKKTEEDKITKKYLDPNDNTYSSEKSYRQALFELDVDYLKKKRDLYTKGAKEWEDANNEINDKIADDQIQKQRETAEALKQFQEEYGKASGSQREKMELEILDSLYEQKLISEEDYQKARRKIIKKYKDEDKEDASEISSEYGDMINQLVESWSTFFDELGEKGAKFWENLSEMATSTYAVMAAALSQYSSYANAERDLEIAETEEKYDKEIEAASKNTKKKEKLEKEKEAKIAEIKTKYNERAMKIEIAQAVAQTAMAAIAAYASASKDHWILGPIAAAMAVTAGALQIATIKKQHQAEAIGYYDGGFTSKSRDNHKEVGVVHANEFVANHKAVANPRLKPLFSLLDSAQRNNTVGSLTAQDVSNALDQGRGVVARAEVGNSTNEQVGQSLVVVGATLANASDAIDRLNKRIDDGIETVMIMDGERGFAKKYDNYQKRINNAKR